MLLRDPLILDLNGNGIELTDVSTSNAHFDYGGTGFSVRTGWVVPTDGILIRDLDHNAAVTANELFGAASGHALADLSAFDVNQDGKIDSGDPIFADLKVWRDTDGDGAGDPGELITLASAGIASINLAAQPASINAEGNLIVATTTFVRTDGSTRAVAEVSFATDTLNTQYTPPADFEFSSTVWSLPSLVGYGVVPDLLFSLSLRPDFESTVRQLVLQAGTMSGSQFASAFEHLVQQWTGADTIDPASAGPLIDARHLAVVEAFYGATYAQVNGTAPLNGTTAGNIESTYQSILDELQIRFASQIPLSQLLNGIDFGATENTPFAAFTAIAFNPQGDTIHVDFDNLLQSIVDRAPADGLGQLGYYDLMARLIRGLRVDLFDEDQAAFETAFQTAATAAGLSSGLQGLILAEWRSASVLFASQVASGATLNGTDANEAIIIDQLGRTVTGNWGDDIYLYSSAVGGSSIISDGSNSYSDKLVFIDANPGEITLSRITDSYDLTLQVAGGGSVKLAGHFNSVAPGIETVHFANGTIWSNAQIKQMLLDAQSAAPSGSVYGFADSGDTLVAGLGGKYLSGSWGADTYVYARNGGDATVADGSYSLGDKLMLTDVNPADVAVWRDPNSSAVTLFVLGASSVTLAGQYNPVQPDIETIQFANGTVWTLTGSLQDDDLLIALNAQTATVIPGTPGNDTLNGTAGADILIGRAGNDILDGGLGNDTFDGGIGDDQFFVGAAGDSVNELAGQGIDRVWTGASYALNAGAEIEIFTTTNHAGTAAINLTGNNFAQLIVGNDGNNIIDGGGGPDTLMGRSGDDQFFVSHPGAAVSESAGQGIDRVWTTTSFALTPGSEIETFTTTNHAGTAALNLTGNAFGQFIMGNDGANVINGGAGADTLVSRAGSDIYLFNTAFGPSNVDDLTDFSGANDIFNIDDAVFAGLSTGMLSANAFFIGAAAHDADDRIIYNSSTGALLFDSDGTGGISAQQFANIAAGLGIDRSYFIVV